MQDPCHPGLARRDGRLQGRSAGKWARSAPSWSGAAAGAPHGGAPAPRPP